MNYINSLNDSSFKNKDRNEDNEKNNQRQIKYEKVLCRHCGRTASNGIRCLGICVADNDY